LFKVCHDVSLAIERYRGRTVRETRAI